MIFGLLYRILTLSLIRFKPVIAKNQASFGLKLFCLKLGLCKEDDILQLCSQDFNITEEDLCKQLKGKETVKTMPNNNIYNLANVDNGGSRWNFNPTKVDNLPFPLPKHFQLFFELIQPLLGHLWSHTGGLLAVYI